MRVGDVSDRSAAARRDGPTRPGPEGRFYITPRLRRSVPDGSSVTREADGIRAGWVASVSARRRLPDLSRTRGGERYHVAPKADPVVSGGVE